MAMYVPLICIAITDIMYHTVMISVTDMHHRRKQFAVQLMLVRMTLLKH